ncbi:RagB/SusD family nutrient uptake outer membrane protein [Arenibacter sp. ARW7G5Y1]|uniref:RagB/SusD family nutrient uptake outer membrane protein n=1 Tax=Arenibacter sp. ARW7G5Y1 TaxID=2135619 RepID=UPI000D76CBD2|nr:RagB/SusD family nutrient uptake outer membrane protein [Arenibacter sp. ARW7G5Y1]PXX23717.1 putative outer membrane starch-binding protein [Arenibacter sp. ARW7G5Y1]
MKRYFLPIWIAIICISFTGCEKNALDKDPLDKLSSGQFWQSKQDFDMGLIAIYGELQNAMFSFGAPNWDVLTDNGYGQHNYWRNKAIAQGDISPSTGGYISDLYSSSYKSIARINIFLGHLNNIEGDEIDAATRSKYEAETLFMRGFYYFQLYSNYGSVPIVTEALGLENQVQPKAPAAEVLAQSLADLDTAIANLSSELYADGGGHVVKTSAQALKLRVLLYAAYGDTGTANAGIMTQARDLALEIMGAGYELSPNFEDVFRDATQEGNPEIIFSIKFLAPDNSTRMDQWYGDWVVISPLQNLVDAFEPSDSRLEKTIYTNEVNFNGNIHSPSNNMPTTYGLKKFLSPDLMPYGYSTQSQQDWVLLRYADVLLMYAEAQNELVGPDQSVYNVLNDIRGRVGMPGITTGLTKDSMREVIRNERRIELAFEGLRYYDLKRWRIAEEVLNNISDGALIYTFEERFYNWPLPLEEIDKSHGILEQNPDYN